MARFDPGLRLEELATYEIFLMGMIEMTSTAWAEARVDFSIA